MLPSRERAEEITAQSWRPLIRKSCFPFYIRREDLAARRFDRVWLILQDS